MMMIYFFFFVGQHQCSKASSQGEYSESNTHAQALYTASVCWHGQLNELSVAYRQTCKDCLWIYNSFFRPWMAVQNYF